MDYHYLKPVVFGSQDPYWKQHEYRRKSSNYSDYSSLSSSPSSSMMTTPSPQPPSDVENSILRTTEPRNFDQKSLNLRHRLLQYLPEIPNDPIACQILLESMSHVVELERQLHDLEQKTKVFQMMNKSQETSVPDDLASVDVSEFQHLVLTTPVNYAKITF